jgi:hypothetical protein
MNRESMAKLRLDRRLIRRRGWISDEELESELGALPDSAEKATTLGEIADRLDPGAAAPDSPASK